MNAIGNNSHTNDSIATVNDDFEKVTQRTKSYWFEDGLSELVVGGLFLLIGLSTLIEGMAGAGTPLRRVSGVVALITIAAGPWLARPIFRKLKERLTYPRTGYISFRKAKITPKRRLVSFILTAVIVGMVVGIINLAPEKTLAWLPLFEGVIIGGFLLYLGNRFDLVRFYTMGVLSILLGAGLSIAGIGDLIGMGIFFILIGFALLISSGLMLRIYLNHASLENPDE